MKNILLACKTLPKRTQPRIEFTLIDDKWVSGVCEFVPGIWCSCDVEVGSTFTFVNAFMYGFIKIQN